MTKLEPTRTSSDLTATERLRRMLDERGVEWWKASPRKTKWNSPVLGGPVAVSEWNGKMVLDAGYVNVTPEQAIAATLGDVPRLPHFWTHDGTLHIEATRMPTRIVVCEGGTCEFAPKRKLDVSETENAKLRELVRAAWRCIHTGASCSDCRLIAGGCTLQTAMRELGVDA